MSATHGPAEQSGPPKWAQSGSASQPRYTRSVQWRHRLAVVLLTVLAGLPVADVLVQTSSLEEVLMRVLRGDARSKAPVADSRL